MSETPKMIIDYEFVPDVTVRYEHVNNVIKYQGGVRIFRNGWIELRDTEESLRLPPDKVHYIEKYPE